MEALLDGLGPEFGRDAYAYHLHRDPYLWSHQVGIVAVADTIGYPLVLSLEGMLAQAGWMRSSVDQVQRYRQAIASGAGQQPANLLARAQEHGLVIEGQRLSRAPGDRNDQGKCADTAKWRAGGSSERPQMDANGSSPVQVPARTVAMSAPGSPRSRALRLSEIPGASGEARP
jgi:hypothetical protein